MASSYLITLLHTYTYVGLNILKQCWLMANGKSQIRGMCTYT